ncbi:S/TP phosphatase regulatory subunit [Acrasis kona]|uniref:S/TP phosphatase regulatory subunit n=1 Tax=Acrasis kona TaxID=1008807 RepID=A0AAW2ZBA6_9EUKA
MTTPPEQAQNSQTSNTHEENAKYLQEFNDSTDKKDNEQLTSLVEQIALNGVNCYNWTHLQAYLSFKIQQLFETFAGDKTFSPPEEKDNIMKALVSELDKFKQAPFTLQRLCELLSQPNKYYKKLDRVLNSIEKCLSVKTTLPQEIPQPNKASSTAEDSTTTEESSTKVENTNETEQTETLSSEDKNSMDVEE